LPGPNHRSSSSPIVRQATTISVTIMHYPLIRGRDVVVLEALILDGSVKAGFRPNNACSPASTEENLAAFQMSISHFEAQANSTRVMWFDSAARRSSGLLC
jgi:hypothetical protein